MEWITADEAAQLSNRHTKNIYVWARKGLVRSKVELLNKRQIRGIKLFNREDVERVSKLLRHGARLDLKPLEAYEPAEYSSPYSFTDAQLEIARKVLG